MPQADEWCHACRAGSQTAFARVAGAGTRTRDLDDTGVANVVDWGLGPSGHRPRTEAFTNAWGLCDMHGNVWEWTATSVAEDPALRLCLGGSWKTTETSAFEASPASGRRMLPRDSDDDLGFRPWRDTAPQRTPPVPTRDPP